jgi:hypothetical protein
MHTQALLLQGKILKTRVSFKGRNFHKALIVSSQAHSLCDLETHQSATSACSLRCIMEIVFHDRIKSQKRGPDAHKLYMHNHESCNLVHNNTVFHVISSCYSEAPVMLNSIRKQNMLAIHASVWHVCALLVVPILTVCLPFRACACSMR